jgi:hypothetical protein
MHTTAIKMKCYACLQSHPIYRCPTFLAMSIDERRQKVTQLEICVICLSQHAENKCKFSGCRKCGKKHNTLLHPQTETTSLPETSISTHATRTGQNQILLSTAIIKIQDVTNQTVLARALLDSGSQSNFITKELAYKLRLPRKNVSYNIVGVDQKISQSNFAVTTKIKGRTTSYEGDFEFLTLQKITTNLPMESINVNKIDLPDYIQLADPSYAQPGKIDMLIGAECFYNILKGGKFKPKDSNLIFQETELGWIVAGSGQNSNPTTVTHSFLVQSIENHENLEKIISKFWKLEEMIPQNTFSVEEKLCIQHFDQTATRDEDGRFIVELPIRKENIKLGNSRMTALRRK